MTVSEPYGTTPFPTLSTESSSALNVDFDTTGHVTGGKGTFGGITIQQPQTQQIAVFEAKPNDESINGASVVAVNQHFVCYAVKNGLIRVLHRHSTLRTLLRSHSGQRVTDIEFFQDGDVLATAGSHDNQKMSSALDHGSISMEPRSRIVVWRVFERSPEIIAEKLLEIETSKFTMSRVVWHPFNTNQFWVVHRDKKEGSVASLVETTRIATMQHRNEQHPVCSLYSDYCIVKDGIQLNSSPLHKEKLECCSNLMDLCWNGRDPRHVLTVFDCGKIVLWDLKGSGVISQGITIPSLLGEVQDSDEELCRCTFLPHEDIVTSSFESTMLTTCFLTACKSNSCITLWSGWTSDSNLPTKVQRININGSALSSLVRSSYILDVCFGPAPADASPPSCFIVVADREAGRLFALHCSTTWSIREGESKKPLLAGCDYVVPFATKHPTYSWSVVYAPTQDISEEELSEQGGLIFDMKLFSYQSTVVQCLTLTSYMCLPPESAWSDSTVGVCVKPLMVSLPPKSASVPAAVSGLECDDDVLYDEDYELDDEEDGDSNEFEGAPDASTLPSPDIMQQDVAAAGDCGVVSGLVENPFSNWLGAIASNPAGLRSPSIQHHALQPAPADQITHQSFLLPMGLSKDTKVASSRSNSGEVAVTYPRSEISNYADATQVSFKNAGDTSTALGNDMLLRSVSPSFDATANRITESIFQPITSLDSEAFGRIFFDELKNTHLPAIQSTIEELNNLNQAKVQKDFVSSVDPLRRSIESIASNGVPFDTDLMVATISQSLHETIRVAFAECIRSALIPAFESISGHVLQKVSDEFTLSKTRQQHGESSSNRELESMSKQLSTMTQLVAKLTDEVQSLRRDVAAATSKQPTQVSSSKNVVPMQNKNIAPIDTLQVRRNEILILLRERNFEGAFTAAIATSTAEMVVFCCRNADLVEVLGGNTSGLSQPILLCLLQQLGTVLVASHSANVQLELEWMQEITLSLSPADVSIQRHVPGVFQQVVNNLNQKINSFQGTDQNQLKRQIQRILQLIRGLQIGTGVHS